jgi:hypothetical protein
MFEERPPVTVFVSHTGANKAACATPLTNYLRSEGVDGVFLDKDMCVGAKPDDEMWGAVTCKFFYSSASLPKSSFKNGTRCEG